MNQQPSDVDNTYWKYKIKAAYWLQVPDRVFNDYPEVRRDEARLVNDKVILAISYV